MNKRISPDVKDFLRKLFFQNASFEELKREAKVLLKKDDLNSEFSFLQILVNGDDSFADDVLNVAEEQAIEILIERS